MPEKPWDVFVIGQSGDTWVQTWRSRAKAINWKTIINFDRFSSNLSLCRDEWVHTDKQKDADEWKACAQLKSVTARRSSGGDLGSYAKVHSDEFTRVLGLYDRAGMSQRPTRFIILILYLNSIFSLSHIFHVTSLLTTRVTDWHILCSLIITPSWWMARVKINL